MDARRLVFRAKGPEEDVDGPSYADAFRQRDCFSVVAILLSIVTVGLAPLLWTWLPDKFKFVIRYEACTFVDATMARIDSQHDDEHLCPVQRIPRLAETENQRIRGHNNARLSIYLGHGTTSYVLPDNSAVLVEFLHLRYVYNALDGVFERLSFEVKALTPHDISGQLDPPPSPEVSPPQATRRTDIAKRKIHFIWFMGAFIFRRRVHNDGARSPQLTYLMSSKVPVVFLVESTPSNRA